MVVGNRPDRQDGPPDGTRDRSGRGGGVSRRKPSTAGGTVEVTELTRYLSNFPIGGEIDRRSDPANDRSEPAVRYGVTETGWDDPG